MTTCLRRKVLHARPFASLVAFAWALFLMVTLKALLDRRRFLLRDT